MSLSNKIILFRKDSLDFKEKFYLLMDTLVTNQSTTKMESILFLSIQYLQILSGFFKENLHVFSPKNSFIDNLLSYIEKVTRIINLLNDNSKNTFYIAFIILFFLYLLIVASLLIFSVHKISRKLFYSLNQFIVNYMLKIFEYILFNIILDFSFSYFISEKSLLGMIIISAILLVSAFFGRIFLNCFYTNSFFLTTSFYAQLSSNYEFYMTINMTIYSFLINFTSKLSDHLFLIYNILSSLFLVVYYLKCYIYYDKMINSLNGIFHFLYFFLSIYSFIFYYIHISEKGLIFVVSSVFIIAIFFNLKMFQERNILLKTRYFKIKNKHYIIYYVKTLLDKINRLDQDEKERALITGIIQMHIIECPNDKCILKTKEKIYLPLTKQWSFREKPIIYDKVVLFNFVVTIITYYIKQSYFNADMIINLSYYFLKILGNYCLSIFYAMKVKDMKLNLQENFSFMRLKIVISNALTEKFKLHNEPCFNLEDLNVSYFYQYEYLCSKFYNQINNEVSYMMNFWQSFLSHNSYINFNEVFWLTDKIRITKLKVEKLWNRIFEIYNGINETFDLYSNYIDNISDDEGMRRELESIRKKNENSVENYQMNFYNILFGKETGVIIVNGDKGREGVIERVNSETEKIFQYDRDKLLTMNISKLMPKIFEDKHHIFMENYFKFGEKRIIDNKEFKTYAKDKNNSIILLRKYVKLFPMLNESVFYVSMIIKEKIDDIIFLDSNCIILGMSMNLKKILQFDGNNDIFVLKEIPFYLLCKQFVNFYKIFIYKKEKLKDKKEKNDSDKVSELSFLEIEEDEKDQNNQKRDCNKKVNNSNDNIEINENIELEYEIKIPRFLHEYVKTDIKSSSIILFQTMIDSEIVEYNKQKEKLIINSSKGNFMQLKSPKAARRQVNSTIFSEIVEEQNQFEQNQSKKSLNKANSIKSSNSKQVDREKDKEKQNSSTTLILPQISQRSHLNEGSNQSSIIKGKKTTEDEKEFSNKLNKYRELFNSGNFEELEDYIDLNTSNSIIDYKFNFTFDKYKFGDNETAYVIRCIDSNKNVTYDNEYINEISAIHVCKTNEMKKEFNQSMHDILGLLPVDRENFINNEYEFIRIVQENQKYQKLIAAKIAEINRCSIIHGQVSDFRIQDDENSSQSSQAGYNEDLCKRNRIEEIRAHTMESVSNFYIFNYMKILIIFLLLCTFVFILVYFLIYFKSYNELIMVNDFNIRLFQCGIWNCNIISSLISLRVLFTLSHSNGNINSFNSYINNKREYFETLRNLSLKWYNKIKLNYGEVEKHINYIIKDSSKYFWEKENTSYNIDENIIHDIESYPLGISQVIANINSLLKSKEYSIDSINISEEDMQLINYANYLAIDNAYRNLIPPFLMKVQHIPKLISSFIKKSTFKLIWAIITYFLFCFLSFIAYVSLILFTNRNIGEGLEMIRKIKQEKIFDILKKLEQFQLYLKKFILKDYQINNFSTFSSPENESSSSLIENEISFLEEDAQSILIKNNIEVNVSPITTPNEITPGAPSQAPLHLPNRNLKRYLGNTRYFNKSNTSRNSQKVQKLKLYSSIYIQIFLLASDFILFMLLFYFFTERTVDKVIDIIKIEKYFLGKGVTLTTSIIEIKCEMAQCDISNVTLNYSNIATQKESSSVKTFLSLFPDVYEYYQNKYLKDACLAAENLFNDTDMFSVEECHNDLIVQSANNTEGLIKLTESEIRKIRQDMKRKRADVNYMAFGLKSFNVLELTFYKYLKNINDNFAVIFERSIERSLRNSRNAIIIAVVIFAVTIILFSLYIIVIFIKRLMHLLSISRCILRIIPTGVIISTVELETWIESKY